ncbi:uncharacterized protein LOC135395983 isoform X1 [Ornithodoros turicata]|uniref:uncharacterized protein LOC135395983 isoform X1 n=1 Tax=Ornithodoros turicata TaxID=34597 RepID=UPI0031394064
MCYIFFLRAPESKAAMLKKDSDFVWYSSLKSSFRTTRMVFLYDHDDDDAIWNLRNIVLIVGCVSILIHVLEFFAFWYLLAAFFIINTEVPKSDDQFWGVLYPALLILHTVIQVCFSILLIVGVLKKRKAYILPWMITTIIECAILFKSAILLGIQSVPASAWIIATTLAFFSVQIFYVACVILYFRRIKKMEREIQPPDVFKCT